MRISKVYTRTGDDGQTSLVGGARVSKSDPRVDAYGEVDELNSALGVARAHLQDPEIDDLLGVIQNDLFTLGADLAAPTSVKGPRISAALVQVLEAQADRFLEGLEPLRDFLLPGGSAAGAMLHLARTIARRTERRVVRLAETEDINAQTIVYLNRLSDLLFVLARVVNHRAGVSEKMADFSKRMKQL